MYIQITLLLLKYAVCYDFIVIVKSSNLAIVYNLGQTELMHLPRKNKLSIKKQE